MPQEATMSMVRSEATFEPIEELRKLIASFDTPTIRSSMAKIANTTTITVKMGLIVKKMSV